MSSIQKHILKEIDRRNLFRYLGSSAVFLPFMRTLMDTKAFGDVSKRRAVFFFYPCGTVPAGFHPLETGENFIFPKSTKPLAEVKSDILLMNNVLFDTGKGNGSRHMQGNNYGLTGCEGPMSNVSIDTYLGQKFTSQIPVLRLGVAHGLGGNDPMHNAVSFTAAAQNGGNPTIAQIEDSPFKAFKSVFGSEPGGPAPGPNNTGNPKGITPELKKSIFDTNLEQINRLQGKLGNAEKVKLGLHIEAIRELEKRVQQTTQNQGMTQCSRPNTPIKDMATKELESSANFEMITDLQTDIAIQAMACGVTNVVFITLNHGTSPVLFANGRPAAGGIPHHETSHYRRANAEDAHIANQAWMMSKFARLIKGMGQVKEGDRSLLYNSSAMAFSEISDSERHNYENMGLVLGGQAGGFFKTGRCIDGKGYTHNNLLVSILQGMGLSDKSFGNKDNGKGIIPALTKV